MLIRKQSRLFTLLFRVIPSRPGQLKRGCKGFARRNWFSCARHSRLINNSSVLQANCFLFSRTSTVISSDLLEIYFFELLTVEGKRATHCLSSQNAWNRTHVNSVISVASFKETRLLWYVLIYLERDINI